MAKVKFVKKCSWCGVREATEHCVGTTPVYCEKCQRELLEKYSDKETLLRWERTRGGKNDYKRAV